MPFVPSDLQLWARRIVPEGIWARLDDMEYMGRRPLEATRIHQWKEAINLSFLRPWFGYGAAAFSVLYPLRQGLWHGHAHNLPLELVVSHGLPVAILVVGMVLSLLLLSFKKCIFPDSRQKDCIKGELVFDRAWFSAVFVLIFLHGVDMPFFDSRINIVGWILLSGLRCLILSNDSRRFLDV